MIYLPDRTPSSQKESSIEAIGRIPQIIQKLPVDVRVSLDLADLHLDRLFDRLIVGPSQFSWAMYEAFTRALREIGVERPEARVVTSGIPIRS